MAFLQGVKVLRLINLCLDIVTFVQTGSITPDSILTSTCQNNVPCRGQSLLSKSFCSSRWGRAVRIDRIESFTRPDVGFVRRIGFRIYRIGFRIPRNGFRIGPDVGFV